jgi:parvulin-like peptidyl-prolyl isomerase
MSAKTSPKVPGRIRWLALGVGGFVLGILTGAVLIHGYWSSAAVAQTYTPSNQPDPTSGSLPQPPPPSQEYTQRAVGYIFGNIPITYEMLGKYLIERCGAEKLELLANKMIIEHAAQERNITVSEAEIEASLAADISSLAIQRSEFVDKVLKSYHKTLFEWKEDVIRPRLLMTKMINGRVKVTEEEIHKGFVAYHGEKVAGRIILWPPEEERIARSVYPQLRDSEEAFAAAAKSQASAQLASKGGKLDNPIGHYTLGDEELEREIFTLYPGQVSALKQIREGWVIFKCDARYEADSTVNYDADRPRLVAEITKKKTAMEIENFFRQLKEVAQYRPMLPGAPKPKNNLKEEVQRQLTEFPHAIDDAPAKGTPAGSSTQR